MKRKKVWVVIAVAFVFLLIFVLVRSSMDLRRFEVEVCIDFNGRSQCRTAAGTTAMFAQRAATDNACATIAFGVTEVINCGNTAPSSVKWLKGR